MLEEYSNSVKSHYWSKVSRVDFANDGDRIMSAVNDWVNQSTRGRIPVMLDKPPLPDTRLILLNAIFFKEKWARQFNPKSTRLMKFFNRGMHEKKTDFMIMMGQKFPYSYGRVNNERVQMVELQYIGFLYSMFIILPEARCGLHQILSDDFVNGIKQFLMMPTSRSQVNLFIPKFEFETSYNLNNILRAMGMTNMFTLSADLTGITDPENPEEGLFVSEVKHKTFVKVDEEGTVAAAVTSVTANMFGSASRPPPPIEFRADHPFLFVIRDNETGIILFIGKVEHF